MGSLVRTPLSEVMATLEIFDKAGITAEHFARVRRDPFYANQVLHGFMNDAMTPGEHESIATVVRDIARSTTEKAGAVSATDGSTDKLVTKHLINTDADPFTPDGWKVEEHRKKGQFTWDPTKVSLYLSSRQKGGKVIGGHDLRKELSGKAVLNANVLDYLLAHPELIPESWKGKRVYFWGTIYRRADGFLSVRCLYWYDGRWRWRYDWLFYGWNGIMPAALASV